MAAVTLILIMYFVLYELRISFCGRIRKKMLNKLRTMFIVALILLILMYSLICYIEFVAISALNSFLGDRPSNKMELERK